MDKQNTKIETNMNDLIENMSKDYETVHTNIDVEIGDKLKNNYSSDSKTNILESHYVIVERRKIIKHAIYKRGVKPHTVHKEYEKKIGFVYSEQPFKNYSFGVSQSDYDISKNEMEKTI
jgi:hypothetical protein